MKRTNKFISFLFIILFCPFVMGAIAAPQNDANYPAHQTADFQVGPKAVSSDDQTLRLSNDMLGLHGPFSLQAVYSKLFGITFEGTYTQILGLKDAALVELDFGGKQRRIAGTWGHALNSNQLFKVTAENLSQDLDFDFAAGTIRKWIYQNAIGGSYAYIIKNSLLNDIDVNAYYSKANSKNLSSIDYISGNDFFRDYRRIAGGVDKSASAGVHLLPTPTTLVGLQANYDDVSYKMQNDLSAKRDEKGLGATVSLDQLINDHVKFNLLASHRKVYQDYKAELDWLVNSTPGSSLELGLLGERIIGNLGTRNDTQGGVNVSYTWGGNSTSKPMLYDVPKADTGISGLRDWVSQPAVRMSQVLALKDERIERIGTVTTPSPKLAAANEDGIEVHPGEAKQIDVTQYFASRSDDKNASQIVYAIKDLPKSHDLKYADGKLIINADSFNSKDVDQKFVINFEPTNINAIPSLSMVSLVLVVKSNDVAPYPNEKYRDTGSEPIKLVLHAGQTYDKTSFVKEDQTIANQIIINQDPDMYDLDWSDAFTGFSDLKIVPNVESKKIPGKEHYPYSHYYILTYSVPEGIPESAIGHHTVTIAPKTSISPYVRCNPVLKIDITVLQLGPAIHWEKQNPVYNVGNKPNEEIADISASPDHKLTDVTITPDGGKAHDLSYYGITANIDKSEPTWKVNLASTTGVILPDPADSQQQYKVTVTDDNTNKIIAEDFTLTVKNGNPTISWKNQKPTYSVDEKPQEVIALGDASTDYNVSDVTITPDGDEGHQLSDYHLTADITGTGTAQATITLKSDDGVVLPDPQAQTQHYKLTVTDSNTNKSVSEDFTLLVNNNSPTIDWKNQKPTYNVGDKPAGDEIALGHASTNYNVSEVTITADGDNKHALKDYNLEANITGKGTPQATIKLKTIDGQAVVLPDPLSCTQHYKLTVTDNNTNKSVSEDFLLTINANALIVVENQTYKEGDKLNKNVADAYPGTGFDLETLTIEPIGKTSYTLQDFGITATVDLSNPRHGTMKFTSDGVTVTPEGYVTQDYKITAIDSKTNQTITKTFTLTVNSTWRYSLCPTSDEINKGIESKSPHLSKVTKYPTITPGNERAFEYISNIGVDPDKFTLQHASYVKSGAHYVISCYYKAEKTSDTMMEADLGTTSPLNNFSFFQPDTKATECGLAGAVDGCKFKYRDN